MDVKSGLKPPSNLEENDMVNFELHKAQSVVDDNVVTKVSHEDFNPIHEYIAMQVRWVRTKLSVVSAEIMIFIFVFSYVVRNTTSTVMIMDKVCEVHLGYSEDTCKNIEKFPTEKSEVTKMTNNYHLAHTLLQMTPAAILALFIGSWSDKYGRKPPLTLALCGIILDGFGSVACAYYFYSRVEYYLIPALLTGLSGGYISVLMVLYSYASDVTTSGKRTMKYVLIELSFGISMPLGELVGGWLFKLSDSGYIYVFTVSTCGHILGLCCVIFLLEETTGLNSTHSLWEKFKNFWTLNSVVASFKAIVKKRPDQGRKQIWLLVLSVSIAVFASTASINILFIYLHHQFNWDNATFSTVSAAYSVVGLIPIMVIAPLTKKKKFGDPVLGIAGSITLGLKNIFTGLAYKVWILHLAKLLGLLSGFTTLAARARISKVVPKEDLGKIFAFMTTSELFLPIVTTAVMSQAFNATLDVFPGLIFVVMGILMIFPLSVYVWLYRLPLVNYEEMEEKGEKESEERQETKN